MPDPEVRHIIGHAYGAIGAPLARTNALTYDMPAHVAHAQNDDMPAHVSHLMAPGRAGARAPHLNGDQIHSIDR
jgi:hypothetical protein